MTYMGFNVSLGQGITRCRQGSQQGPRTSQWVTNGIMEKKVETTIGFRGLGFRV